MRSKISGSLRRLLEAVVSDKRLALGYKLSAIDFGERIEATLEKGGGTFVMWLKPGTDATPCYRRTARFNIGYNRDPPDRLGFALLNAMCTRIAEWERALPQGAQAHLFGSERRVVYLQNRLPLDAATHALLADAGFSPIYEQWLELREQQLAARLRNLEIDGKKRILLVNATRGLQFYPSIVDFFSALQRTQDGVGITVSSYFEEIFEFHQGVADKGLNRVGVDELLTWGAAEINRFDVVLFIGPSDVLARLMALEHLAAKLVLLDLGFFHQLLEAHAAFIRGEEVFSNKASQINPVVVYSCQPEVKIKNDLAGVCALDRLQWRWFNYIPIGFAYCKYYRSTRQAFDVGLFGTAGRDYGQLDPALFRGLRFLFVGAPNNPGIERLRQELDVTVVSGVDQDIYARLLALCRCVVLPAHRESPVYNVFLSVLDTIASGKALVTPRHIGLDRLELEGLPAAFYDNTRPAELHRRVDELLHRDGALQDIETRSIAMAKENLDVYRVLGTIVEEQVC